MALLGIQNILLVVYLLTIYFSTIYSRKLYLLYLTVYVTVFNSIFFYYLNIFIPEQEFFCISKGVCFFQGNIYAGAFTAQLDTGLEF